MTSRLILTTALTALVAATACTEEVETRESAITSTEQNRSETLPATERSDEREAETNMAETDRIDATNSDMSDGTAAYNDFLKTYVVQQDGMNLVRYGDVTDADHQALKTYIGELSAMDASTMSQDEEMAYWFNLYNAKTLDVILDNYPVDSIKDIGSCGPWKQDLLTVNGQKMSLDNIEHDTVRAKYDEPRVHYAFNCASIGCPDLKMTAWEAATLDRDLTAAAKAYIDSPRGVRVEGDEITVSKIFDWYEEDFGGNEEGVLAHLAQYATGAKKTALQAADDIDDTEYDWDLNIAR